MSLATRAKDHNSHHVAQINGNTSCTLMVARNNMPAEEQEALDSMMVDPKWSAWDIYLSLKGEGYSVGQHTVERHKIGRCRCVFG